MASRLVREEENFLLNHLQSKDVDLREIATGWFESIFFDILPWQSRSAFLLETHRSSLSSRPRPLRQPLPPPENRRHGFLNGFLNRNPDGGRAFLLKFGLSVLRHRRNDLMETAESEKLQQQLTGKMEGEQVEEVLNRCLTSQREKK